MVSTSATLLACMGHLTGNRQDLQKRVGEHPFWHHTIEIMPGAVTPGWFDLRPVANRMPWPDVKGKRCLDIGTFDGFRHRDGETRRSSGRGDRRRGPPPVGMTAGSPRHRRVARSAHLGGRGPTTGSRLWTALFRRHRGKHGSPICAWRPTRLRCSTVCDARCRHGPLARLDGWSSPRVRVHQ
jgi:hypothetical protein